MINQQYLITPPAELVGLIIYESKTCAELIKVD